MRINGTTPLRPAARVKSRGSQENNGGFQLSAPAEEKAAAPTSGPEGLQSIDALLMLQSVDTPAGDRERATAQGNALLDELDELKVALLEGRMPVSTLDALTAKLATRERSGDDNLDRVLDEIEVRARVELAKLGRFH